MEYVREWRLKNFEKVREYSRKSRIKYRESMIAAKHKRRAAEKSAKSEVVDYGKVYLDHGGICGICDRPVLRERSHFDHIVPLDVGGRNTADNLHPTHKKCNSVKGNRTLEWARNRVIRLRELGDNI